MIIPVMPMLPRIILDKNNSIAAVSPSLRLIAGLVYMEKMPELYDELVGFRCEVTI
jgi:hypothetical protein